MRQDKYRIYYNGPADQDGNPTMCVDKDGNATCTGKQTDSKTGKRMDNCDCGNTKKAKAWWKHSNLPYMCNVDLLRNDLKTHFEAVLSKVPQVGRVVRVSDVKPGVGEIGDPPASPPVAAKESIKVAIKSDGKPNIHFGYANHSEITELKKRGVLVRKLDKLEKHEIKLKNQAEDLRKKEVDTKAKGKACGGCCGADFSKYYLRYASQGKTNQEKIDKAKLALATLDQRIDDLEADPLTSMPVCAYITFEEEEGRLRALHEYPHSYTLFCCQPRACGGSSKAAREIRRRRARTQQPAPPRAALPLRPYSARHIPRRSLPRVPLCPVSPPRHRRDRSSFQRWQPIWKVVVKNKKKTKNRGHLSRSFLIGPPPDTTRHNGQAGAALDPSDLRGHRPRGVPGGDRRRRCHLRHALRDCAGPSGACPLRALDSRGVWAGAERGGTVAGSGGTRRCLAPCASIRALPAPGAPLSGGPTEARGQLRGPSAAAQRFPCPVKAALAEETSHGDR